MLFRPILAAVAAAALSSSLAAQTSFEPSEPIGVPADAEQGIDFIYVDPQLSSLAAARKQPKNWMLHSVGFDWGSGEQESAPNPLFLQLRNGLEQYQMSWGRLPQVHVPAGATLSAGSEGERVAILRQRLGLPPGDGFDDVLAERVREYQRVHGLKVTGAVDSATIRSLNRGADHYLRRILVNLERARRLPESGKFQRYVLVDSGAAEIHLFDRDRVADSMRAIVGAPDTRTPMMALLMRGAKVNPYWNVPPDLIRSFTARKVLKQGVSYLNNYKYEVLSDWTEDGVVLDPKAVDWKAVAAGQGNIRVRQLPGPWNSMGEIKFETPNRYGIYLHDTPNKELFAQADRWISNGCVRLEDAERFASWVFGEMPQGGEREEFVRLPQPVPVFMTYLTVAPSRDGVEFRGDRYGHDQRAMQRMFGASQQVASLDY